MTSVVSPEAVSVQAQAWTEQRLGDVLAAIGNHEAKALTFLAMREDVAYGVTAIYRRFLEIQGPRPAWIGVVTMAQKYVVYSFAPIGLVARQRNEGGFLRHVRHDPDGSARALAGFLLAYTEKHPAALTHVFGSTATNAFATSADRPPIRRLRLLRVLAALGPDLHTSELAEFAEVNEVTTGQALAAFDRAGLLTYRSGATYDMRTVFRVGEPVVFARIGNTAMRDAVAGYLNARLHAAGGPVQIDRQEIEDHLLAADERWRGRAALRDQVQKVMKALVERGQVEAVNAHYGATHSQLAMTGEQQAFLIGLVEGIDAIAAGDPQAIAAGRATAEALLDDPDRVCALVRRAFAASKLASNPLSEGRKRREVQAAVERRPGATSAELLADLGANYSKALLAGALGLLVRDGLVHGVVQPDGPYKRWYPTDEAAPGRDEAS
ncbi:MAG: hypothetical protein ACT4QF_14220 [Sporichthyaceae bacterium]